MNEKARKMARRAEIEPRCTRLFVLLTGVHNTLSQGITGKEAKELIALYEGKAESVAVKNLHK